MFALRPDTADPSPRDRPVLVEGETCWRVRRADRAAFLIDGAAYFLHLKAAFAQARRSILILGWDIHSRLRLTPQEPRDGGGYGDGGLPDELGPLLDHLTRRRRGLHVHILIWDWLPLYSIDREKLPWLKLGWWTHRRVRFVLDGNHPPAACHHQKIVVVDDRLAFVGGLDLAPGRWDRREHPAEDPLRVGPDGRPHGPFHDAVLMVDGPAAASIGELARERWRRATGRRVPAVTVGHDPWPPGVMPWFENVEVGIARTEPAWDDHKAVAEVEALYLAAIRSAKRHIYIENQYLTATRVAEALAERLEEPDGPEVLIVTTDRCEGFFETAVMDVGRARFLRRLNRADRHLRLRVLHPVRLLPKPTSINVHAKLMVVDDRLVCIGSANLANRSMGLDTESVLAIEAVGQTDGRAAARAIAAFRNDLLAEHMEATPAEVEATLAETGSLLATLERHNGGSGNRRLETLVLALPELMTEVAEPARLADPPEPLAVERVGDYLLPPPKRRRLRGPLLRLGLLLVALVVLAAAWRYGPLGELLRVDRALAAARGYADSPLSGLALVLAGFALGGLLMVPLTLMVPVTAVAFGLALGFGYALAGAMLSAAVNFALGRLLGRDLLRRLAGRRLSRRLNLVGRRLADRGVVAVTLLRFMPVAPFGVVNLAAGASGVRARDFLLGSLLGLTPGVAAFAALGRGLEDALRDPSPGNFLLLGAVAVGVVALSLVLHRWSRRRARQH